MGETTGILAVADHLHALKRIYNTLQERETPKKSIIGPTNSQNIRQGATYGKGRIINDCEIWRHVTNLFAFHRVFVLSDNEGCVRLPSSLQITADEFKGCVLAVSEQIEPAAN